MVAADTSRIVWVCAQRLWFLLETSAGRVKSLERHTAELDDLRREIGNLKLEVEGFREAD